jgi:hypothetical protein
MIPDEPLVDSLLHKETKPAQRALLELSGPIEFDILDTAIPAPSNLLTPAKIVLQQYFKHVPLFALNIALLIFIDPFVLKLQNYLFVVLR